MPDRETVIDGMMRHMKDGDCGIDCPYWNLDDCSEQLYKDVLTLLREQEPVRCKDCKYCEYPDSDKEWCKKGHLHGKAETWFCADGERR